MKKLLFLFLMLCVSSQAFAATSAVERKSVPMAQKFITTAQDLSTTISNIVTSGVPTQLNLAPGNYNECDNVTITTPMNIAIVGAGMNSSKVYCDSITGTTAFQFFTISGQDATSKIVIRDLGFWATSTSTGVLRILEIDQTAGTSLTRDQFQLINIRGYFNLAGSTSLFKLLDVALYADNLDLFATTSTALKDVMGIDLETTATTEIEGNDSIIKNSYIRTYASNTTSANFARPVRAWKTNTAQVTNNAFYSINNHFKTDSTSGGDNTACYCVNDSTDVGYSYTCYFENTICDGSGTTGSTERAIRATANSNAPVNLYLRNTNLVGRNFDDNDIQLSGTATKVFYNGSLTGGALLMDNTNNTPKSYTGTGAGRNAVDLISAIGAGGPVNATTSGAATGGEGADAIITLGAGGAASTTTGAGTGGSGGDFVFTGGAGADQTNASGTTNTGGAGGYLEFIGGAGGAANSGSSTDTGGAGESIYLAGGAGGVGTDATGANGNLFLGITKAGVARGNVMLGSVSVPTGPLVVNFPAAQTIAAGNVILDNACGTLKLITSAGAVTTDTTNTFTAPAAGNKGCPMTVINIGANNITLDNNALFKSFGGADVVMTANDSVQVASNGSAWYQTSLLVAN